MRGTLQDLEGRKRALEQALAAEAAPRAVDIHPNVAELYRRKVSALGALLEDETMRTEAVEVIRSMVDRIEVNAGARRGQPKVVLVGALASILDYACSETRTAASGGGAGRVLVVAGARNQRYLPKLPSVFLPAYVRQQPSGIVTKADTRGL